AEPRPGRLPGPDDGGAAMKNHETKSTVLLGHHLKALKLPTMHAECEKVARRCAAENVDHLGFLLQLCELELIERERRSAERLLEAREERQLGRVKAQLAKLDLLILDELGYVPASKAGAELLFDVISRAYERSSVIVTSNLPFEQWTEVLLSERLTGATLDRLTHRCTILETGGESYRLRAAR